MRVAHKIALGYSSDGDLPYRCQARSPTGLGIRKFLDISGIRFFSKPTIVDAHNTSVRLNANGTSPVNILTQQGVGQRIITIEYNSLVHVQNHIVIALQNDPIASSWVEASVISGGHVGGNASYQRLTSLSCLCSGGQCEVTVEPVDDFPARSRDNVHLVAGVSTYRHWPNPPGQVAMGEVGHSDFEYRLTNKQGDSDWKFVQLKSETGQRPSSHDRNFNSL